jgi:hypothetical protein
MVGYTGPCKLFICNDTQTREPLLKWKAQYSWVKIAYSVCHRQVFHASLIFVGKDKAYF